MHLGKKTTSPSKKYPPGSFIGKLRKRRIIETVIALLTVSYQAIRAATAIPVEALRYEQLLITNREYDVMLFQNSFSFYLD